jgi:hypothetical protein
MKIQFIRFLLVGVLLLGILTPPVSVHAAGITVTNLHDTGAGSLRQAIIDAIAGGGAEILFNVSGTITLDSQLPTITEAGGELIINGKDQTVEINGNNAVRVLSLDSGAQLILNNLTIANGYDRFEDGGGIYNAGTLSVMNTTFTGNYAWYGGGAIFNNGSATIANSTFSGNGVSIYASGGGAILNNGSTATLTITNSTFSGNYADLGSFGTGAIFNRGSIVTLSNTILANDPDAGNCAYDFGSPITNGGNNIDDGATCGWASANGSMSNTDPLLGPLTDNGGSSFTFALLAGSPAIDGVTYNPPNGAPLTDQRGSARPQGAVYDIGSYEFEYVLFPWIYLPLVRRN